MNTAETKREAVNMTAWALASMLRGIAADPFNPDLLYSLVYCMYLDRLFGGKCDTPQDVVSRYIEDDEVRRFIEDTLIRGTTDRFNDIYPLLKIEYAPDVLKSFIEESDEIWARGVEPRSTPAAVCDLALSLLKPARQSRIVDFGSGIGTFMMRAERSYPDARVSGIESNQGSSIVARIRMSLSRIEELSESFKGIEGGEARAVSESLRADIRVGDMLSIFEPGMCDRAFSNYPCGLRNASFKPDSDFLERAVSGKLGYSRPTSADWTFNHMLANAISDDGRAVAIMSGGACYNTTDEGARRYFIEHGLIESVISLPPRIFPGTGIGFTIVVLSNGNESVRMVDASDLIEAGRRTNELSADAVAKVAERLSADVEGFSRTVGRDELAAAGYSLSPAMYLKRPLTIKNARKLGDVVREIRRGATLRANELDELSANEATDCRYLMLRDIQDGEISDDLPFLGELDPRLERHCIEDGDVLISKNGAPFKIAVAEVPEGARILANGNLYMLKVDRDSIDPYYLAAFLSSNKGMEVLSRAVVGVTIPSIPLRNLREIPVPVPPLEEQAEIAAEYQGKIDEIRVLRLRVKRAVDDMRTLFDGEE